MNQQLSTDTDWPVADVFLTARVDIEEAVWEGSAVATWRTKRVAVPASIELVELTADHTTTPPTSTAVYRVVLSDPMPLNHLHRLRSADGDLYRVDRYRPAGTGTVLPEAETSRLSETQ